MFRHDPSNYGVPNLAADIVERATAPAPVTVTGEVVTVGMSDRVLALESTTRVLVDVNASLTQRVRELERDRARHQAEMSEQGGYREYVRQLGQSADLSARSMASAQDIYQARLARQYSEALQQRSQRAQHLCANINGGPAWSPPEVQANAIGQAQAGLQDALNWSDLRLKQS